MRFLLILIASAALAGLAGCSSDDTTAPDPPADPPLAEETIDGDGGTLSHDDTSLEVPSGCFDGANDLELHAAEVSGFDLGLATDGFYLSGFPAAWEEPVTIRIRAHAELEGGEMIAVGFPFEDEGTGNLDYVYDYLDATVDGEFLVAQLPPLATDAAKLDLETAIQFFGLTGMTYRVVPDYENRRYSISYHMSFDSEMDGIIADLDAARAFWTGLGFSLTHAALPEDGVEPMKVDLEEARSWNLDPDEGCRAFMKQYEYDLFQDYRVGRSYWRLYHHVCRPDQRDRRRQIIGSYYFHLIHDFSDPWMQRNTRWLRHAVRGWAEDQFAATPGGTPLLFSRSSTRVLNGFPRQSYSTAKSYGSSAAAMIKFLVGREGAQVLPIAYNGIRQRQPGLDALLAAVSDDPSVWWPDFVHGFVQGQLYEVPTDSLLAMAEPTWTVSDGGSQQNVWTTQQADLSAAVHRIALSSNELGDGATLQLTVASDDADLEDLEVQVYRLQDGQLTFMARSTDVTITDLGSLVDLGADVLAVVTCAAVEGMSDGTRPITLTASIIDEPAPEYNAVTFSIRYHAFMDNGSDRPWQGLSVPEAYIGTWAGTNFTATWDHDDGGVRKSGQLTLSYDPAGRRVLGWSYQMRWTYDAQTYTDYFATGGALDLAYEGSSYLRFDASDDEVCDHLTNIGFIRTEEGAVSEEVTDWSCNDDSYVELYLRRVD